MIKVPEGYALVGIDALKAWGKYEEVRDACRVSTAPQAIPPELDVRTLLLAIEPGADGMGEEVYAKSVADVEAKLTALDQELEELERQLEEARKQMDAQKDEWLSWEAKRKALEKESESYRQLRNGSNWPTIFASHDAPEPLRGENLDAAIEAQGVPDALREEAVNLASILSGMVEGGYSDLETLYTEDQADGDAFVKRAAEVLDLLASAQPAPQVERCKVCNYQYGHQIGCENNPVDIALKARSDMRIFDAVEHYGGVKSDEELFPAQASVVQQEPANVRGRWNIELDGDDLLVCFNDHDKGGSCSYQRYVPSKQAKRQPLSEERLEDIALDVMGYAVLNKAQNEVAMELMRKVEAAHGITKGPQQ